MEVILVNAENDQIFRGAIIDNVESISRQGTTVTKRTSLTLQTTNLPQVEVLQSAAKVIVQTGEHTEEYGCDNNITIEFVKPSANSFVILNLSVRY